MTPILNRLKVIYNGKQYSYILLFFFMMASQHNLFACDCANPPRTFMTSISEFTAELEVVKIDTIRSAEYPLNSAIILSKLKVVRSFSKNKDVDYIWMVNSLGPDCQRGLSPNRVGQKYIITGRLLEDKRYQKWIKDDLQRTFLYVTTCGKTVLDVEGNNVIGVITKSNNQKIKEKYDHLMKEDKAKATAYYEKVYLTKHHKDLVQTMAKSEFYTLMEQ